MAKQKVLKKSYVTIGEDGKEALVRSAVPGATALRIDWSDGTPEKPQVSIFDFSELTDDVRECAMRHGVSQKVGDVTGKADLSVVEKRNLAISQWEDISGPNGTWTTQREGSGETRTDLFTAICMVNKTNKKRDLTEDELAKIQTLVAGFDADAKKRYAADDRVYAALKTIRADRAAAVAKAARAKAKDADESDLEIMVV